LPRITYLYRFQDHLLFQEEIRIFFASCFGLSVSVF